MQITSHSQYHYKDFNYTVLQFNLLESGDKDISVSQKRFVFCLNKTYMK